MRTLVGPDGGPSPLAGFEANEANALKYIRADGHYLGAHVDDRQLSGEVIVNLSLAGDAVMLYTHDKDKEDKTIN